MSGDLVLLRQPGEREAPQVNCSLDLDLWTAALRAIPAAPVTEDNVLSWAEGPLRRFFPFERFFGAYGRLSVGRIQMRSLVSSGYTAELLAGLQSSFELNARGCFSWWVSNRRPFMLVSSGAFDERGVPIVATKRELDEVVRFSLGPIAAHGIIDPFVMAGTYISFAGVPLARPRQTMAALAVIAPVLHSLFLQTKQPDDGTIDPNKLTERQRELVDLAMTGLSDKAIALRLGISDNTVGNHFRAIYAKLGISKRGQLIALMK